MAGGSGGLPKLDGRNYAYWKARMAGYLEAINPIAWAVMEKHIVGPWNEDQVKYGAISRMIYLMLLVRRFLLVFIAKRPLLKFGKHLKAIYVGEEKYQVLKEKPMKLFQMDVKSAFLNGFINELVFVEQPPGFETLDILIMFIGCTRRSTGSSKHQGLGMNTFVTSLSTKASRSGGWIQLYSQKSSMKSYLYVKFMLMISFLVQLTPLFAKNLEK